MVWAASGRKAATNSRSIFMIVSSAQFSIGGTGFVQNRDGGIGVFPECEELVIALARGGGIALDRERARQAESRHRTDRLVKDDAGAAQDFAELRGGVGPAAQPQQRFPA